MVSAVSHARRALIGPPGWRFFSFWLALAITNLGTWAGVVALQLQILDMTGDQAYVSAVVVAEFLPAVILGTVLGHLLDRLPPRTGLVACEFIAAAAWALMVTTGRAGTIVALALVCGVTTGIFRIVSSVVVPMLVDDHELDAANGAILSAQTLTNVAGAALGGLLVALTSAHDVLLLNALTFVISGALLLLFSRVPRNAATSPDAPARGSRSWLAGSVVGARRCLGTPMLRMIMFSLPVASLALGVVIAGSVPILRDTYGASDFQTGVILALDALGIAIGGASLRGRRTGYLTGLGAARDRLGRVRHRAEPADRGAAGRDRRRRQRDRDRALPHDDATRDAAARARQHDRLRVRGDVQPGRRRPDRRRAAHERPRAARDVHACGHGVRARRPRRSALLAEHGGRDGTGARAARGRSGDLPCPCTIIMIMTSKNRMAHSGPCPTGRA